MSDLKNNTTDPDSWARIYKNLSNCTFQTVFGYICLDLCVAICLHYVAKYCGVVETAGYGFAYTCMNILIVPFGFGLNVSLNMHAAQALGVQKAGLAKRYLTLNAYMLLFTLIPLCFVLLALKIPFKYTIIEDVDETSDVAWIFLYYLLPASILALQFEGIKTYLIANKITYPFTIIHLVTTGLNWLMVWLLMAEFDLGIHGAGIAILATEILNLIGLFIFIYCTSLKTTVFQNVKIFPDFKKMYRLGSSYLRTSMPILLHIYAEYFVFFLLSFISLSLGTDSMNAHQAIQNSSGIVFRFPISISMGLVSYVGSEMGKGNTKQAQRYVWAGMIIFFVSALIITGLLYLFKEEWADFYAADQNVRKLLLEILPWMVSGITIANGAQGTINGALKGINKINLVFYSTLIAYYIICIPLVAYFAYGWGLDLGVVGVWQAFGIANVLLFLVFVFATFYADWEKESLSIRSRVHNQNLLNTQSIVEIS